MSTSGMFQVIAVVGEEDLLAAEGPAAGTQHPVVPFRVATGVRKINDYQFLSPHYRLIIDFLILYRLILSTFLFSGYMAYLCTQLSGDFKNRWRGLTLNIYFKCCSLWQACIILRLQWKLQIQSIQSPFFNPFSFLRHLPPLFGCLALFFAISITTTTTADHSSLFSHFWLNLK